MKKSETNFKKHEDHFCANNDGECICECYSLGYEAGRKESIMALDSRVAKEFNKDLKDESSDLVKIVREGAIKQLIKQLIKELENYGKEATGVGDEWKTICITVEKAIKILESKL